MLLSLHQLVVATECPSQVTDFSYAAANDPVSATYDFADPALTYTTQTAVIEPASCAEHIQYRLEYRSGPVDLLTLTSEVGVNEYTVTPDGSFVTADFSLYTTDAANVLSGTYTLAVVAQVDYAGVSGTESLQLETEYQITINNGCESAVIEFLQGPFSYAKVKHFLSTGDTTVRWTVDSVVKVTTADSLDCGEVQIDLIDLNGDALEPAIFTDFRDFDGPGQHAYQIAPLTEESGAIYVGEYELYIQASLPAFGLSNTTPLPLIFDVLSRCTEPYWLRAPQPENKYQEYFIGDPPLLIGLAGEFDINPANCPIAYSFYVLPAQLTPFIAFDDDTLTFSVETIDTSLDAYYNLTLRAEVGRRRAYVSFNLTVLNECMSSIYSPISFNGAFEDLTYAIYSASPDSPKVYTHDPFTVSDDTFIDCGPVEYRATIDGFTIFPVRFGVISYDPSIRTFEIYSDDLSQVGPKTVAVRGGYFSQVGSNTLTFEFELNVLSPCDSSEVATLAVPAEQPDADAYYYTGDSPPAFYALSEPFLASPDICIVEYSCVQQKTAEIDLCALGTLDSTTGLWTFESTDPVSHPPGTYTIEIVGSVGAGPAVQKSILFDIELVSPCRNADLNLRRPLTFQDRTQYFFESPIDTVYDVQGMVTINVLQECGKFAIEFYQASGAPIDPRVFDEGLGVPSQSTSPDQELRTFTIFEPSVYELAGTDYEITYRVYLEPYPSRQVFGQFTVQFILRDDCDERLVNDFILSELEPRCIATPEASEFTPRWMELLQDQTMVLGGNDLRYAMGIPVNYKGEVMDVSVDFSDLWFSSYYDVGTNSVHVINDRLESWALGPWVLTVSASYVETDGTLITHKQNLGLTIFDQLVPDQGNFLPTGLDDNNGRDPNSIDIDSEGGNGETDEQKERVYDLPWELVYTESGVERSQRPGPVPFVKKFGFDGELVIGWSTEIVIPSEFETETETELEAGTEGESAGKVQDLPNTKVAVEQEFFTLQEEADGATRRRRHLQTELEVWEDETYEEWLELMVVDAIQVSILRADPDDTEEKYVKTGFTWVVKDLSADQMVLQFNFEEPEDMSQRSAVDFDTFKLTFFETRYFKDAYDNEVPFGTELIWKVFRQVNSTKAQHLEDVRTGSSYALYAVGFLVCILCLSCGPLLPVWMFFNSLQLFAHLPLIRANIPAEANYFLWDFISIVRLQIVQVEVFLEEQLLAYDIFDSRDDYSFIQDNPNSRYNELLYASGYHVSLQRNLLLFGLLAILILTLALIVALKDLVCFWCCRRQEPWVTNILVRFIYEVFFEVCICLMISFSITGLEPPGEGSTKAQEQAWTVAVGVASLLLVLALFLTCLCCRGGPYKRNTFERSLWSSCWQLRPIKRDLVSEAEAKWYDDRKTESVACTEDKNYAFMRSDGRVGSQGSLMSMCEKQVNLKAELFAVPEQESSSLERSSEDLGKSQSAASRKVQSEHNLGVNQKAEGSVCVRPLNAQRNSAPGSVNEMGSQLKEEFDGDSAKAMPNIDAPYITFEKFGNSDQIPKQKSVGSPIKSTPTKKMHKINSDPVKVMDPSGRNNLAFDRSIQIASVKMSSQRSGTNERPPENFPNGGEPDPKQQLEGPNQQLEGGESEHEQPEDPVRDQQPVTSLTIHQLNLQSPLTAIERPFQGKGEEEGEGEGEQHFAQLNPVRGEDALEVLHEEESLEVGEGMLPEPKAIPNKSNCSQDDVEDAAPPRAGSQQHLSAPVRKQLHGHQVKTVSRQATQQIAVPRKANTYENQTATQFIFSEQDELMIRAQSDKLHHQDQLEHNFIFFQEDQQIAENTGEKTPCPKGHEEMGPEINAFEDDYMLKVGRSDTARPLLIQEEVDFGKPSKFRFDDDAKSTLRRVNSERSKSMSKYTVELSRKAQLVVEAKLRVTLAGQVRVSRRYQTLFNGLKKNHPHNAACVHPLMFLVRRVIYAAILIFMYGRPLFGSLLLSAVSIVVLCWVLSESQWESGLINQQHIVNEIALYFCVILLVLCSSDQESALGASFYIGWAFVGLVSVTILYNVLVIAIFTCRHIRFMALSYLASYARKRLMGGRTIGQIMPAPPTPPLPSRQPTPLSESDDDLEVGHGGENIDLQGTQANLLAGNGTSNRATSMETFRVTGAVMLNPISEEALSASLSKGVDGRSILRDFSGEKISLDLGNGEGILEEDEAAHLSESLIKIDQSQAKENGPEDGDDMNNDGVPVLNSTEDGEANEGEEKKVEVSVAVEDEGQSQPGPDDGKGQEQEGQENDAKEQDSQDQNDIEGQDQEGQGENAEPAPKDPAQEAAEAEAALQREIEQKILQEGMEPEANQAEPLGEQVSFESLSPSKVAQSDARRNSIASMQTKSLQDEFSDGNNSMMSNTCPPEPTINQTMLEALARKQQKKEEQKEAEEEARRLADELPLPSINEAGPMLKREAGAVDNMAMLELDELIHEEDEEEVPDESNEPGSRKVKETGQAKTLETGADLFDGGFPPVVSGLDNPGGDHGLEALEEDDDSQPEFGSNQSLEEGIQDKEDSGKNFFMRQHDKSDAGNEDGSDEEDEDLAAATMYGNGFRQNGRKSKVSSIGELYDDEDDYEREQQKGAKFIGMRTGDTGKGEKAEKPKPEPVKSTPKALRGGPKFMTAGRGPKAPQRAIVQAAEEIVVTKKKGGKKGGKGKK